MSLNIKTTTSIISVIPASKVLAFLHGQLRKYGSLVSSAALHLGVLLVLAACVFPVTISRHVTFNALFDTRERDEPVTFVLLDDPAHQPPAELEISAPLPETNRELPDLDITLTRLDLPAAIEPQPPALFLASPGASADSSSAATSIEMTVDRITESIQGKLQQGDLLVVWLLDASHSMADDRRSLASRLDSFLQDLTGGADSRHQLLNAVVSFGAATKEQVAPTESRSEIVSSVRELPVDASGRENVFAAIEECAAAYRRKWRDKQLMVVVWTDESGDDVTKLENTIRICKDHAVSVSVVGPSAVLGAQKGWHSFTNPQSRQIYHLPVKRGPDSALPERLELGYWFLTQEPRTEFGSPQGVRKASLPSWYGYDDRQVPGYSCIAALEVPLPSWYGGSDLKGLISGFGAYALTRLTLQTGGSYIIFDRDEDRGPFVADAMRAYLPDYRSQEEYVHDVQSRPLRRAVMEAVELTRNKGLGPPPTILFGKQSETPPHGFMRTYFTPAKFVANFNGRRSTLEARAHRTARIVEQALARLGERGVVGYGLEHEYEKETSRRWRAWYDLTRGRLLATSVRLEEYRLACDAAAKPGFFKATTNHLIFVPSLEMRSSSDFRRRAKEAERLLKRCVRDNANTPWAWLAQRELDYGLGIVARQHVLKPVVMPPSVSRRARLPKL